MKKHTLLFFTLIIVLFPLAAFAQEQGEEEDQTSVEEAVDRVFGQWKRNYASPTFGMDLFFARVKLDGGPGFTSTFDESKYLAPAVDLRIFKGVNISKRGGFYTGLETGMFFFIGREKTFHDTVTVDDTSDGGGPINFDYDFTVSPEGGVVFLMSKYGLRLDIGVGLIGFSLGGELGMGASLYMMNYNIEVKNETNYGLSADEGYGSDMAVFGIIMDASVEAALRFGKNFRVIAKAGMIAAPMNLSNGGEDSYNTIGDMIPNTPDESFRYALQQYRTELDGFGFGLRVGFVLNFN